MGVCVSVRVRRNVLLYYAYFFYIFSHMNQQNQMI